jgi:hypothetical protein
MSRKRNKRVVCADGFTMSVQAFDGAYCEPRYAVEGEPYSEVEVGYPSQKDPDLESWIEDHRAEVCEDTGQVPTVYAWVPVGVVASVIAKHGGMVSGELPLGVPTAPRVALPDRKSHRWDVWA